MDATSAHWIFQVVSRRYARGSIVLTSNRGFGDWGAVFADGVVAAAILDRLLRHATVVNIRGQSYRMRAHVPSALIDLRKPDARRLPPRPDQRGDASSGPRCHRGGG